MVIPYKETVTGGVLKKGVLKNFKTPTLESLFDKVVGLQACNFIKKKIQHKSFSVKLAKFLRTPIFKSICERLLRHTKTTKVI